MKILLNFSNLNIFFNKGKEMGDLDSYDIENLTKEEFARLLKKNIRMKKARKSQLPIYKAALDLNRQFMQSTQKVPRIVRYTDIAKMHGDIMKLLVLIRKAEMLGNRLQCLEEARLMMDEFMYEVRALFDMRYITVKGFDAIMSKEGNLTVQLNGWLESVRNNKKLCGENHSVEQ